jgi:SHS2 domain-containing protein
LKSGFEIFDHTADIGIQVHGDDLSSVFAQAAAGMFSIIFHEAVPAIKEIGEYRIKLNSPELDQLLVDWLNELLFIFETEHIVCSNYKITIEEHEQKFNLDAIVHGEKIADEQLLGTREIKAVTYHMLFIKKAKQWQAQVLFDI